MELNKLNLLVIKLRYQKGANNKNQEKGKPLQTKNPKKVRVQIHLKIQTAHQKMMKIHGKFFHIDMMNLQRLKFAGGMSRISSGKKRWLNFKM
jgi:hypothetical protein